MLLLVITACITIYTSLPWVIGSMTSEFMSDAYSLYYINYNAYLALVLIHSDELVSACTFSSFCQ